MRLLNISHLLDPESGGGTAERTFQLGRFLPEAGVECTLLTLDIGVTSERVARLGAAHWEGVPCLNRRYFVPRISQRTMDRIVAGSDIVQLTGHWTLLNAMAYRSCRKLCKPFLFCPAGALKPFGRSLHLKHFYDIWVGRGIAQDAAACVAITEQERDDFTAYGVPEERIVVIPNGVDPNDYADPAPRGASSPDAPYVLYLGRLAEIKGPDLLLQAFAQVAEGQSDLHLVFAGPDGGLRQTLSSYARQTGLTARIHFAGYVAGREKLGLLCAARLLAIPSRREAMSIVVLEAGMCGTPVLFTDSCGLDALARDGAGTMVQATADSLAEGLQAMLEHDEETRVSARQLAHIVRTRYLWRTQAERYRELLDGLLVTA